MEKINSWSCLTSFNSKLKNFLLIITPLIVSMSYFAWVKETSLIYKHHVIKQLLPQPETRTVLFAV